MVARGRRSAATRRSPAPSTFQIAEHGQDPHAQYHGKVAPGKQKPGSRLRRSDPAGPPILLATVSPSPITRPGPSLDDLQSHPFITRPLTLEAVWLATYWGGVSLARDNTATLIDTQAPILNGRTELVQRLLADTCELCGSTVKVQVHHIRAMKDLRRKGRAERPAWVEMMARRRRKTRKSWSVRHATRTSTPDARCRSTRRLPECHYCELQDTGEPDAVKVARPVRRGADGKVLRAT